ncbi:hypothetical protein OQA88_5859 [Cercophora sp. LCS_1]
MWQAIIDLVGPAVDAALDNTAAAIAGLGPIQQAATGLGLVVAALAIRVNTNPQPALMQQPYQLLNVSPSTLNEDIKAAYEKAVAGVTDEEEKNRLHLAYRILTDPISRCKFHRDFGVADWYGVPPLCVFETMLEWVKGFKSSTWFGGPGTSYDEPIKARLHFRPWRKPGTTRRCKYVCYDEPDSDAILGVYSYAPWEGYEYDITEHEKPDDKKTGGKEFDDVGKPKGDRPKNSTTKTRSSSTTGRFGGVVPGDPTTNPQPAKLTISIDYTWVKEFEDWGSSMKSQIGRLFTPTPKSSKPSQSTSQPSKPKDPTSTVEDEYRGKSTTTKFRGTTTKPRSTMSKGRVNTRFTRFTPFSFSGRPIITPPSTSTSTSTTKKRRASKPTTLTRKTESCRRGRVPGISETDCYEGAEPTPATESLNNVPLGDVTSTSVVRPGRAITNPHVPPKPSTSTSQKSQSTSRPSSKPTSKGSSITTSSRDRSTSTTKGEKPTKVPSSKPTKGPRPSKPQEPEPAPDAEKPTTTTKSTGGFFGRPFGSVTKPFGPEPDPQSDEPYDEGEEEEKERVSLAGIFSPWWEKLSDYIPSIARPTVPATEPEPEPVPESEEVPEPESAPSREPGFFDKGFLGNGFLGSLGGYLGGKFTGKPPESEADKPTPSKPQAPGHEEPKTGHDIGVYFAQLFGAWFGPVVPSRPPSSSQVGTGPTIELEGEPAGDKAKEPSDKPKPTSTAAAAKSKPTTSKSTDIPEETIKVISTIISTMLDMPPHVQPTDEPCAESPSSSPKAIWSDWVTNPLKSAVISVRDTVIGEEPFIKAKLNAIKRRLMDAAKVEKELETRRDKDGKVPRDLRFKMSRTLHELRKLLDRVVLGWEYMGLSEEEIKKRDRDFCEGCKGGCTLGDAYRNWRRYWIEKGLIEEVD